MIFDFDHFRYFYFLLFSCQRRREDTRYISTNSRVFVEIYQRQLACSSLERSLGSPTFSEQPPSHPSIYTAARLSHPRLRAKGRQGFGSVVGWRRRHRRVGKRDEETGGQRGGGGGSHSLEGREEADGKGGQRGEGSAGDGRGGRGRNGIRVEGRLRECQRGLRRGRARLGRRASRGPRRSRSSRFLSRHRFIFFLSLPSLPRVFFVPVSIPISLSLSPSLSFPVSPCLSFFLPLAFPRASISFCLCYHVLSLPRSLAIVLFGARGVFRGKRPGLVDGPSHGLQLSPNPSYLPVTPYPAAFLSPVSLPFSVLISLFLRHTLYAADSLFAPRSCRVFFATLHTLRGRKGGREEGGRTANEPRRRDREGLCHPMY